MHEKDLEVLCRQYKKHFEQHQNDGKDKIVECFRRKEFDRIAGIMQSSEGNKQQYFAQCIEMA